MKLITFNPWLNSNKEILKNFNKKKDFFLGDWCLKNFNTFDNEEFKVVFGGDKSINKLRKFSKFSFPFGIYNEILKNLHKSLNLFHKKNENIKYWEFIINTWLWVFIDTMQKRWHMIENLKKVNVNRIITLDTKRVDIATLNSKHIKLISTNSILWNIKIFNEILDTKNFKNIEKIKIKKKTNDIYINKKSVELNYLNFSKLNKLNTDFFFYNLAISKRMKFEFLLKNLQIPLFAKQEKRKILLNNDKTIRKKWKEKYKFKNTSNNFVNFLNKIIPEIFPRIFLDKFSYVKNTSRKLNWPKEPKKIISSFGHFDDDVFKSYVSDLMSKKKSTYSIIQHGAGGIYKEHIGHFFEQKISNKYFTWGWKNNKKNYPLFVTTNFDKTRKQNFSKTKFLLPIYQFPLFPQRSGFGYSWHYSKNTFYTNFLLNFLSHLKKDLIKNIHVKCIFLYKPCIEEIEIKKKFKGIKFINTSKKTHQISHSFQLTIETFLSTGFFESMTLNRPVILLFNPHLINLNKEFYIWIKKLRERKICFTNLSDAIKFINFSHTNLKNWWYDKKLQNTREEFCNAFARDPEKYKKKFYEKISK